MPPEFTRRELDLIGKHSYLLDEIEAELADPEHAHREHGRRSTYVTGCRGILCRKDERDDTQRRRSEIYGYTPQLITPEKQALYMFLDLMIQHVRQLHAEKMARVEELQTQPITLGV